MCRFKETKKNPKEAASGGWRGGAQGTQLTEVKSAKPKEEALEGLAEEEGANGSFPLNGSPNPFLFWNGSLLSAPSGWNGSGGSGKSAEPSWLTGVLLPGKFRRKKKGEGRKRKKEKEIQVTDHRQNRVLTKEAGKSSRGHPLLLWKWPECRLLVGQTPGESWMDLALFSPYPRGFTGLWAIQENHF